MSRSLVFAFLLAVFFHWLLAFFEPEAFKRPVPAGQIQRTLSLSIVKPEPVVKKNPALREPAVVTKRAEKRIPEQKEARKKAVSKPGAPAKGEEKKVPQPKHAVSNDSAPPKEEFFDYLPPPAHVREKRDAVAHGPDPVPSAGRARETAVLAETKETDPPLPPEIPITAALPVYRKNSPPQYPVLARKRNYQGTVILEVLVRSDGTAGSVRLVQSSGHDMLDGAALKGVQGWLFHPARRGEEPVDMWVQIPIRFHLQ